MAQSVANHQNEHEPAEAARSENPNGTAMRPRTTTRRAQA